MGDERMEIIRWRERKRLDAIESAKKWVSTLNFRVSAILIGSYARGDFNLWSDIDVILVSDTFRENPLERLKRIDPPPGFQVIPLNLEEFERLHNRSDILIREALEYGIILRDDFQLCSKLPFRNRNATNNSKRTKLNGFRA